MFINRPVILALALNGLLAGATAAQPHGPGRAAGRRARMPSARTEVAVAEVDGKIYVVGGFGGERELEIYDQAADRWSRGASFPREVHHAAAVGVNGKLYVVGGYATTGRRPTPCTSTIRRPTAGACAPQCRRPAVRSRRR